MNFYVIGCFICLQIFHLSGVSFATSDASSAKQALLIDLVSGHTLLEKNAHEQMAPSSMTKILTTYMLLDALKHKELKLDSLIHVSENAAKQEGSRMFLVPNKPVSVEDILKGIVVDSGNDASTALAENLGGSESLFAEMMNEKAKELGAKESHFVNASGLPSPKHWSTCWDLAVISKKLIEDFPEEYTKYFALTSFKFNGIQQFNRNRLLKNNFADGIKTGLTSVGKYGIVASAQRNGRRLLLVLNGMETDKEREAEAKRLLSWGFQFFSPIVFFQKGQKIRDVPVWNHGNIPMVSPELIGLSLPKRTLSQTEVEVRYYEPLIAPIKKGQKIGVLIITAPKQNPLEFPLVAGKDLKQLGIMDRVINFLKSFF